MAGVTKDMTGQSFGSLTAIRISHRKNDGTAYWLYRCTCGKEHVARGNVVSHQARKGDPELPSCGCVELKRKTRHGYRKVKDTHPAYRAQQGMVNRCYNPNTPGFEWYGGAGVTVCDEWKNDPEAFVNWALEHGWAPGLHIDKDILCDALGIYPHVYAPHTCQWVSAKRNVGYATNRDNYGSHPNVKLSHEAVSEILEKYSTGSFSQSELARQYHVNPSTVGRLVHIALGQE